jgi:uncharacterized zinc-type alcohol dehydrogenase-like protein
MAQVIGYAAKQAATALVPFSFQRREPGAHDVQIEIRFCGVCHSDVHQVKDEWGGALFPMVPGHEIVGTVAKVGAEVTRFKVGDSVGVGCFVDSCRTCSSCKEGLEQYCDNGMTGTYNGLERDGKTPTYGGYSSHIVVDDAYVLRIPAGLALDGAAPLLCAGITTYSPLKHWQAGPGKRVAIVGLGGLGHMGVKLARALGADVTILSQSLRKQADGERLGAHHFYATSDPATFEKLANSFDLILNTVSAEQDLNQYLGLLKRDGTMVLLGAPPAAPQVAAFGLIGKRRRLAGSLIGGIAETQEMLDFCGQHGITSDIEVIAIKDINEAYERMIRSDVKYRFVIDMSTLAGS